MNPITTLKQTQCWHLDPQKATLIHLTFLLPTSLYLCTITSHCYNPITLTSHFLRHFRNCLLQPILPFSSIEHCLHISLTGPALSVTDSANTVDKSYCQLTTPIQWYPSYLDICFLQYMSASMSIWILESDCSWQLLWSMWRLSLTHYWSIN